MLYKPTGPAKSLPKPFPYILGLELGKKEKMFQLISSSPMPCQNQNKN